MAAAPGRTPNLPPKWKARVGARFFADRHRRLAATVIVPSRDLQAPADHVNSPFSRVAAGMSILMDAPDVTRFR
jgi:hypothetical protein